MSKVLVVSYSLGGNTRYVADEIAKQLGADSSEILDPRPREGVLSYLQAGFEAVARGLPSIIVDCDPADYDFVVLGTPVWAGSMSSPMRSFLFTNAQKIRNCACFCTMGSRGATETLGEMKALLGASAAPTLSMTEAEVRDKRLDLIFKFVDVLRSLTQSIQVSIVK